MSSKRPKTLNNGRYEILEPVGTGSVATVFRAHDHQRQRTCAIKLLLPSAARSPKTRRRFLAEATTMAELDHPNVVSVTDVGAEGGPLYFVMELARGGSLSDVLRAHGARAPREALALMFQALQGLSHAHTQGVVHRDIKPHNMLLAQPIQAGPAGPGPRQQIKLTDFGIAKRTAGLHGLHITSTGDTLGTLAYMSPEQRNDPRNAGPRSDLYGVGATLYRLVTGRRPFDLAVASDPAAVLQPLPRPLRSLLQIATATDPAERYPTAEAMAEAVALAHDDLDPAGARLSR